MPEDIAHDAGPAAPGSSGAPEREGIGKTTLGEAGKGNKIAYLMVALLVILTAAIGIFVWSTAAVKGRLETSTKMKIADVDKELASRSDAEKQSVAVKIAVDNIQGVLDSQKIWSKLLTTVKNQTLKSVRLTEVSTEGSGGGSGTIQIKGMAKDHFEVARMAASIRDDSSFKDVTIEKSTFISSRCTGLTIEFAIKAKLTGGALKKTK